MKRKVSLFMRRRVAVVGRATPHRAGLRAACLTEVGRCDFAVVHRPAFAELHRTSPVWTDWSVKRVVTKLRNPFENHSASSLIARMQFQCDSSVVICAYSSGYSAFFKIAPLIIDTF